MALACIAIMVSKNYFGFIGYTPFLFNKYDNSVESDSVNIVMISDAAYVNYMNIAIYSVIKNKIEQTKLHFFIIGDNLSKESIGRIKNAESLDKQVVITVLNNKYNIYKFLGVQINEFHHVPQVDLLKFAIPYILPNIDKILYLDGDIIVQGDLSQIYNVDIKDEYVAAVEDGDLTAKDALNIPRYFNNGVMLLNLAKMRRDNLSEELLKIRFQDKIKRFVTQDTFNQVMFQKIKFMPSVYNCIPLWERAYGNSCENAVIIHWAGRDKPWKSNVLYRDIYQKYLKEYMKEFYGN